MLNADQVREIARAQSHYLAMSLGQARLKLRELSAANSLQDADQIVEAMEHQLLMACRAYERSFSQLKGFIDVRNGQTPVDHLHQWIASGHARDALFDTLCQWVMAQRLHARLLVEKVATPVSGVALTRFCLAIRDEAMMCIQQARGECAVMLLEEVTAFCDDVSIYTGEVNANVR